MAKVEDEDLSQLATRIPRELHRRKLHCVDVDASMADFVTAAIEEKRGPGRRGTAAKKKTARQKRRLGR